MESVLDGLVKTILSQYTTELNSERAFASLRKAFPTWQHILEAESKHVEDAIRCGGLAPTKSSCIKNLLSVLLEKRGKLCMEYLRELSVEEVKAELSLLKGIGPKTNNIFTLSIYAGTRLTIKWLLNLLMLFSVITTNLFALYAFTYHPTSLHHHHYPRNISLVSEKVSLILREIESSQKKLAQMEKDLLGNESIDLSKPNIAKELKEFLTRHQLPLGKDSRTGITEMVASAGHSFEKSTDLLSQFMNYKLNGLCPDDWSLGQKLILQGCEPLPRRRCFAKTIPKVGLQPFPSSLWNNVSEKSLSWSGLGCKNLACLNSKKLNRDYAGCFDITHGYETQRYAKARSKNDFHIDDGLAMSSGGLRTSFDLGGGSGTFAARMAERNLTVETAMLNMDAPFNEFIAARGLFPLYISLDSRFPFYDNVFDLVHVANGLVAGGRPEKLEFLMFDIDRVVRAGGLFWLDNDYCSSEDKRKALTRLIERFGYKKLKLVVGEKINGAGNSEVYLSAVLQKPVRS